MARYFFHIHDGTDFIRDDRGGTFDMLSEAHHEAITLARSFVRDMGDIGAGADDVMIEVCDESGAVLRTVDASETMLAP